MDSNSFTSQAWPVPAEVTPLETLTTDASLVPEFQLTSPLEHQACFGSDTPKPTTSSAYPFPKTSEILPLSPGSYKYSEYDLPGTASWSINDEVLPIMSVASWVQVMDYIRKVGHISNHVYGVPKKILQYIPDEPDLGKTGESETGVRPKDTLLRFRESPDPASSSATRTVDGNDSQTVELHGQDLARESTESVGDEDEVVTPVVPKMATRNATNTRRSASGAAGRVAKPTNKKVTASTKTRKRKNDPDDLARRTCESCGIVFVNWHAKK
jgi:hypothetical protein